MTDRLDKPANTAGANKFDLINVITISSLRPEDKVLLIELVMRWNKDTGQLNPSVERLAKQEVSSTRRTSRVPMPTCQDS